MMFNLNHVLLCFGRRYFDLNPGRWDRSILFGFHASPHLVPITLHPLQPQKLRRSTHVYSCNWGRCCWAPVPDRWIFFSSPRRVGLLNPALSLAVSYLLGLGYVRHRQCFFPRTFSLFGTYMRRKTSTYDGSIGCYFTPVQRCRVQVWYLRHVSFLFDFGTLTDGYGVHK